MKLLTKTSRILLAYAIIVLLISIPLFYFVIEQLYYQDVDDALRLKKEELVIRTKKLHSEKDLGLWLAMDNDVKIKLSGSVLVKDSIYPRLYLDTLAHEMEPYRELSTSLKINDKTYHTIIRRSLVESQDLIVGIAEVQGILLVIMFIGWLLINRRISKRIWEPFDEIIAWLEKYEVDKNQLLLVKNSGIVEFDILNKVVNDLVVKNHRTYTNQKNFIENASHEMQTPVAILQSKLDLLVQSAGLTAEQARYLQSLYEVIERLNHLNSSLLLLSRIENQQFADKTLISVKSIMLKVLDHLEEITINKQILLKTEIEEDRQIEGNSVLVEILISNLLANAVHHTPESGTIHLRLTHQFFFIENSGLPLPFDTDKLFIRFGKKNVNRYGVGLGLAIAKEICQLYHLEIKYTYSGSHRFTVYF
jgi:signal transduction histidine kinase